MVKSEYRQLIAETITSVSYRRNTDIDDNYLQELLHDGSRFNLFFYNRNKWYEALSEEEIPYSLNVYTGEWQFHVAINNAVDEIEEFLVRFNPRYLEKIEYLEIYDENSVEHFLTGRHDSYLLTNFFVQDFLNEFGMGWSKNILIRL